MAPKAVVGWARRKMCQVEEAGSANLIDSVAVKMRLKWIDDMSFAS